MARPATKGRGLPDGTRMLIRTLPALGALVLAACSSDGLEEARANAGGNPAPCPNAFALDEAARMIVFDGEPSLETVAWSAEVTDVRTSCRYTTDKPIDARVEVDFAVGRGPAATSEDLEVGYFVAVTRRDKDLIAKEEFVVPVTVRDGLATVTFTEEIKRITIPRANENTSGTNFEIAVGFALSREQLLYNRSGRSLKFPEL